MRSEDPQVPLLRKIGPFWLLVGKGQSSQFCSLVDLQEGFHINSCGPHCAVAGNIAETLPSLLFLDPCPSKRSGHGSWNSHLLSLSGSGPLVHGAFIYLTWGLGMALYQSHFSGV